MKQVLALSSSRVGNGSFLETAVAPIRDLLGQRPLRLAFIPFAAVDGDYEAYGNKVREGLQSLPHSIDVVHPNGGAATIEKSDAILTGGGNTFKLLHDLYAGGLLPLIRKKVESGTPYIGWSAGANITGSTLCTTNDMPEIQPQSFAALGFLPFQLNPHYINLPVDGHNGETRDQRLGEFAILHPGVPVIGLPEGTGLHLQDSQLWLTGDAGAVLFSNKEGRVTKEPIAAGADLSFLL